MNKDLINAELLYTLVLLGICDEGKVSVEWKREEERKKQQQWWSGATDKRTLGEFLFELNVQCVMLGQHVWV